MSNTANIGSKQDLSRQERLAAELRANLKKRKDQARARAGGIDRAAEEAGVSDPSALSLTNGPDESSDGEARSFDG